jgi:L-idonate 5-dehydrogenase
MMKMNTTMTAAVLHGAKEIKIEPQPMPELKPGMVLLRVRRAGICGSDLHYFEHGYCAAFVPTRPFILGHEFTAEVVAAADGVETVKAGARVTVNPARSCGFCEYCKAGRPNLCRKIIMLGSASTQPPTDGAFAEFVTVRSDQCHALPSEMDDSLGAMIEPFAVALQAVKRAGAISGKRALVAGGGPIGLLVAMTARNFGAAPVALSDIVATRRKTASQLGADFTLDPTAKHLAAQVREIAGDGFDVIFEASGARPALRQAFDLVRPGGTIVQIGTLGTDDVPLPANQLMNREINFIGSMRYGDVFDEAIRLIAANRIDLRPLLTRVLPLEDAEEALRLAADKNEALKVQIEITGN